MKNVIEKQLWKAFKDGHFPTEKNKLWTMCQVTLKIVTNVVEEAERLNMTNEQFFIAFEDALNLLSIKDHNNSSSDAVNFTDCLNKFYGDSE